MWILQVLGLKVGYSGKVVLLYYANTVSYRDRNPILTLSMKMESVFA